MMRLTGVCLIVGCQLLTACSVLQPADELRPETIQRPPAAGDRADLRGNDVVLYALSLIDTGYRFGGKNPEAGLDCSGMVSYIYQSAAGLKMSGSAAEIARLGRPIGRDELRPGDLVFFNTRQQTYSHVGIYIGDARFIHAPSSQGRVRIDQLGDRYYAERFTAARSYFN